ncbi:hypothetical protein FA95DRAFT_1198324 [Auriscalpium vulgare]|uniref:Uncharacterized protein n=1 Tax=Auriscalpium vulgare TaxID=40419 RepID=A0ACB8RUJ7_9AGAM|nr:hypothetical protein FA95DRAFT_1198324 [Auriscalpium vulgare]
MRPCVHSSRAGTTRWIIGHADISYRPPAANPVTIYNLCTSQTHLGPVFPARCCLKSLIETSSAHNTWRKGLIMLCNACPPRCTIWERACCEVAAFILRRYTARFKGEAQHDGHQTFSLA